MQCLISGGSDAKIIVWDTATGERLHLLRDASDSMMAIQDLVVDFEETSPSEVILVSSSSDPHIRRWRVSLGGASQVLSSLEDSPSKNKPPRDTILEHDTSVYKLLFWGDDGETDIWTASADGTAKCLSRAKDWATEEMYEHGDYVRAVAITDQWVVTAGRDENVKIWDKSSGKLWHVYEGHYEEVTGLVLLENGLKVVSVSIDGTVRVWPLSYAELDKARKEREAVSKGLLAEACAKPQENLLTEEEEAELAELMDSGDECEVGSG